MSRRQPDLVINALWMPLHVSATIEQQYEDFGGFTATPRRFANGAGLVQEAWRRVRTSISASGLVPPGLFSVDWTAPVTMGCVAARSIQAPGNVFDLPAARRADAPPFGFAITAGGMIRPVDVAVDDNQATLAPLAGAVGYQVLWYPVMTVLAPVGPVLTFDAAGAVSGWQLIAEEV